MQRAITSVSMLILALACQAWGGVVDVSIEPSLRHAILGDTVSFEVWLRNIDSQGGASNVIEAVELDLGDLPAGLSFVAGPGAADGFAEHDAPIPSELDGVLDGSLLDGHVAGLPDLSYVAFGAGGIPANDSDRLVGTFWVRANAAGVYQLSLDNLATSILSGDIVEYTKNYPVQTSLQCIQPHAGDANNSGTVDVGDLGILAFNWGQSPRTWSQANFTTPDTVVDVGDLV